MSVSEVVKKLIEDQPFLLEALSRGILNFGNLANELKPKVETILEKEITESAIVMALRRYAETVKRRTGDIQQLQLDCEITMKTAICDFNIVKSPALLLQLKDFYGLVDLDRGDFLNITVGNHEISIAVSQKHAGRIESLLEKEKILDKQLDLVAVTINFGDEFFHTPGIIYQVLQALAWRNINLLEIISTLTELTIVIEKKYAIKSYEVLHDLVERFDST